MSFKPVKALGRILNLTKRIRVIFGGTWAGKTYCILAVLISLAALKKRRIRVIGETIIALKQGAIDQFKDIMQSTNRWVEGRWNATDRAYHFANGSIIKFESYDTVGKAKAAGKWDISFFNEANHQFFQIVDACLIRTVEAVYIDYNPDNDFWVDTEILPRPDAEKLVLTYLDNDTVPQQILDELSYKLTLAETSEYWRNWCDVYVYGKKGNLQGRVFDDWKLIDTIPSEAFYVASGLDYGYNPDPSVLIDMYQLGNKLFFDEVFYQTEMNLNDMKQKIKTYPRRIFADHRPDTNNELRMSGINIEKANKGTVVSRIVLLKGYECYMTSRSLNLIKENKHYIWATDKTGGRTGEPIDKWNHAKDAAGYAANSALLYAKLKPTTDAKGPDANFIRGDFAGTNTTPW